MPAPRIVKAATSADLLKLVPALTGVDPRESLVLVAFRGKRTAGAMRFDLPDVADPDGDPPPGWAERVVGTICRLDAVDGVVPVAYTDAAFAERSEAPRRALLETVAALCSTAGLAVKDLLCVGGDGWAVIEPGGRADPRPLLDLVPDDLSAIDDVLDARVLTVVPDLDESAQQAFTDRVEAWLIGEGHPAAVHDLPVTTGFRAPGGFIDRVLAGQDVTPFVEAALADHPPAPAPCDCRALLAALVCAPVLRDVVMLQAAWGMRFARHVALHCIPRDLDGPVDEATILAFSGGDFARPDSERVERAARMLVEIAGHLLPGDRGPVLATAGWLRWTLGQGSMAGRLTDLALEAEPDYGLADIMRIRLAQGDLPEWAFHPEPGTRVGRVWAARVARSRTR